MKKSIVYYYSNTGNNKYLAQKIAESLQCRSEEIVPKIQAHLPLITLSAASARVGLHKLQNNPSEYERVILCTPIWMGSLIAPTRSFLQKYEEELSELVLVTCCGSTDEIADEKFGYKKVFGKVKEILGDKLIFSEAVPILLSLPEQEREDDGEAMKARLNDDTFKGDIKTRFEMVMNKLKYLK